MSRLHRLRTICAAGYANNTTAATACSACPPGSFSANLGQVACDLCPVNTYNPSVAQTSCLACPQRGDQHRGFRGLCGRWALHRCDPGIPDRRQPRPDHLGDPQ
ncbi:MAG: hypothetical protein IPO05_16450 [Flavobacteriales bacterium]|nr:hypothetical protein [Flavobacteriales bacterium]